MKTIFDKDESDKNKEPVVAYMRYSSNNQDEKSIQYQRSATMTYAHQKNYFIEVEYIDEARTGTNDRREGFQDLIKDARSNPQWKKILVYDYSRFTRNVTDSLNYTAELEDLGIKVISVTQAFEDTPEGFLMKGIVALLNDYYSRNLARYAHAGLKQKAENIKHCGGLPPLGYNVNENDDLVINEEEAEIVRLIFDLFEINYSYSNIAKELNKRGFRTKTGKEFCANSFSSILTQEKYIGTFFWNKRQKKSHRGHRNSHRFKSEEEQVRKQNAIPAIIEKDQFFRVQKIISSRKQGTAQSKSRHFYLLGGINKLKCAECGANLIGTVRKSRGKEYKYYYCPNHKNHICSIKEIRADYLDKFVIQAIVKDIYMRDDLISVFNDTDEKNNIRRIKTQILGLEKSQKNILKSLRNHSNEELLSELKNISKEKSQIETTLDKISAHKINMTPDNRRQLCLELSDKMQKSEGFEVKRYLMSVLDSIIVSNDDVKITMNIA